MTRDDARRSATALIWFLLALAGLLVMIELAAPALIARAYRGEGLEVLNRVFQGRNQHTLDYYLDIWEKRAGILRLGVVTVACFAILWYWKLAALVRPILSAHPVLSPRQVFLVGAWFGAITGFVEAALVLTRYGGPPASGFAWERVWMAPLASIPGSLLIAFVLLLVTRATVRGSSGLPPVALRSAVFVTGGLAAYAIAQRSQFGLTTYAAVILSAGLAAVFARLATSDAARFMRVVRITSIPMAGLVLAGSALGAWNLPGPLERRRLASLRSTSNRPDILLIVLDTERASSMSLYGYNRETTPRLDRFAQRGVVFDRAIAPAPWTLPSHASMFTGRYPHEMSADIGTPLDDKHRTIAEVLSAAGYATAAFVANQYYTTAASGLARGFARYEDFPVHLGTLLQSSWLTRVVTAPLKLPGSRKPDEAVTNEFLRWQASHGDAPYFAFLNYMGAHSLYPDSGEFRGNGPPNIPKRKGVTRADLDGVRAAYDNGIAQNDHEIGRMLDSLERQGRLDNTVVVITSDHGEHLGGHGLQEHANSLYMPLLHVPLVICYEGKVPAGTRIDDNVTLRDIPTTLLELAGVQTDEIGGESLSRFWTGPPLDDAPEPILSELNYWGEEQDLIKPWDPVFRGSMKSLILGDTHYIRNVRGEEQVFDLADDPNEQANLKDRLAAERLRHLRATLDSIIRRP